MQLLLGTVHYRALGVHGTYVEMLASCLREWICFDKITVDKRFTDYVRKDVKA